MAVHTALLPLAKRVFWWGQPPVWCYDPFRLAAPVMTQGDWNGPVQTLELPGGTTFQGSAWQSSRRSIEPKMLVVGAQLFSLGGTAIAWPPAMVRI